MHTADRRVIVGDIGATSMRFAIADHDELHLDHYVQFRCAEFSSVRQGLAAYLKSVGLPPTAVCLAIAGVVEGSRIRMNHRPWVVDIDDIRSLNPIDDVLLINEDTALALALPHLSDHDLHRIGGAASNTKANRAVVSPGTGLGVAGVTFFEGSWVGMAGEGGHVTFAAQTREEFEIFERLRFSRHHVSWEHVLSGPGLVTLYRVLHDIDGCNDPVEMTSAEDILAAAEAGEDLIAARALEHFINWLGRFAGDVALTFGAQGGLYLGGGLPARILGHLDRNGFRAAFENKGRLSPYLEVVPVFVIKAADAGLRGAAIAYSESPDVREQLICAVG